LQYKRSCSRTASPTLQHSGNTELLVAIHTAR
jgi:hypothetical protein